MTNTHPGQDARAPALRAALHLREARDALQEVAHHTRPMQGTDWNKAVAASAMCESFAELVRTIGT